jgi:hypothetical protein
MEICHLNCLPMLGQISESIHGEPALKGITSMMLTTSATRHFGDT